MCPCAHFQKLLLFFYIYFENKLKTILLCTLKVRLFLVFMQRIFWWKGKHAEFKIKSCLEIKYEINTDLPSARTHHFKSVEQGLLHWYLFFEFCMISSWRSMRMLDSLFSPCHQDLHVVLAWRFWDSFFFWPRFYSKFTK